MLPTESGKPEHKNIMWVLVLGLCQLLFCQRGDVLRAVAQTHVHGSKVSKVEDLSKSMIALAQK